MLNRMALNNCRVCAVWEDRVDVDDAPSQNMLEQINDRIQHGAESQNNEGNKGVGGKRSNPL